MRSDSVLHGSRDLMGCQLNRPGITLGPKEIRKSENVQAPLFPAGLVATVQSRDIDDLTAVAVGWNRECTQLRAGRFFGKIAVAHTNHMQMGRVSWNTDIQARGQAPRGTRVIAVPIGANPAPSFCGAEVGDQEIVTEQEGIEVEFRGAKTCEYLVMSIGISLLRQCAVALWGEPFESRVVDGRMHLGSVAARLRLAHSWWSVFARVQRDPETLSNAHVARMVEQSVVNAVLVVAGSPPSRSSPARRQVLARRAEEFIRGRIDAPIALSDVCDWVGASERSLHLGFTERFGMSSMAYLKVLRLNRVRRQLRDAAPGTSVTDVAMRSGFSHLGRFATDYGRFFGEYPSATLRHLAQ